MTAFSIVINKFVIRLTIASALSIQGLAILLLLGLPVATALPTPPDRGSPGSGTTPPGRGTCDSLSSAPIPLLPYVDGTFSGATAAELPTFWFYIPEVSATVRSGQFILQDSKGNKHYRIKFEAPTEEGLVRIKLPEGNELAPQPAIYRWYFTFYCVDEDSPEDIVPIFQQGTIERMQLPNLAVQLADVSLENRIELRAEKELWYDLTVDLVEVRQQPDTWHRLLELLDLKGIEKLEHAPIVELVPLAE